MKGLKRDKCKILSLLFIKFGLSFDMVSVHNTKSTVYYNTTRAGNFALWRVVMEESESIEKTLLLSVMSTAIFPPIRLLPSRL